VEKSIYQFILRYSLRDQIILLIATAVSFPFLYYSYDLPKLIINHIKDAAAHKGGLESVPPHILFGMGFGAIGWLMLLSFVFLCLTVINGAFKYFINVFKGRLGERMLRRLRYTLYSKIICFPLLHFKKVSAGELIPMITAEVEPLGGFIGDAFVTPVFQGGLLLVPLVFILIQDLWLGLAAVALYPVQGYLIPKIQRRVNELGKERIRTLRKLSDRIGETVNGALEIRANDTSRFERADFSDRLGIIYHIRFRIYVLKFLAKYINNTFDKLTPFFFFSAGGYLALKGQIDLGALVAVINAQKDLAAPWRELLDYYQAKEDSRIKYEQVVEQFQPPEMIDEASQFIEPERIEPFRGELVVSGLSLFEDARHKIIDNVSFRFPLETHAAMVGTGASGKEELGLILARLIVPNAGRITIGDKNLAELPEAIAGRRIGYVGQNAYLFSGTVGDNLFYTLKHKPDAGYEPSAERQEDLIEAARVGNVDLDIHADWIDREGVGADTPEQLKTRGLEALRIAEMEDDVYQFGLRGVIDPVARPDLAARVLEARAALRGRLAESSVAKLVEVYERERYNTNASVGENLLFGTPVGAVFDMERLGENPYVLAVLDRQGLTGEMLSMGREAAATMVELFADLPPGSDLFEQYSFISADDLPEFQALLTRVGKIPIDQIREEDRGRLLNLPFKLVQARHRLDLVDERFKDRILEARTAFAENLPDELRGSIEFFDIERYNATASLQENILFGKVAYGQAQGAARVNALIQEVLASLNLRDAVMAVGLEYNTGSAGARLSSTQRQKLAIARAVLKRPDVLVMNEALAALDSASQSQVIENLLKEFKGRGFICVTNRAGLARNFDLTLVMSNGRMAEHGAFAELNRDGTQLHELMKAE
jgi:putative ABC transport system ATP-binding protein